MLLRHSFEGGHASCTRPRQIPVCYKPSAPVLFAEINSDRCAAQDKD
ncbi:hypothetical protein A2U01_0018496, partial [Trifolium medium]|nr:hypothetical protein [Trifolium medium]